MLKEQFFSPQEEFLSAVPETTSAIQSEHSLWRADIIAQRYSQLPSFHHNIRSALTEDIRHLIREDILQEKNIQWTEEISARGVEGNGYDEAVTEMTQNYIAFTAKEFGDTSRAVTEHAVMQTIEDWAVQTADLPGNFVVWISPPGPEYFGISSFTDWNKTEKFCSKINIKWSERNFDKSTNKEVIEIKSIQLTAWPNVSQLIDFWEDLNHTPFPNTEPANVLTDLIGNLTFFNDPRFTPESMLAHVSDQLYKTQATWEHAEELPQIETTPFWKYEEACWNSFYLPKALKLLQKIPVGLKDTDPFWNSQEYQKIITSLDVLFHYFYRHIQSQVDSDQPFLHFRKNLALLEQEYKMDIAIRVEGKQVSEKELERHNTAVSSLISVGNRAFSISQCGLLAPFTAPMSAMNAVGNVGGVGGFSMSGESLSSEQREKMNSPEYQLKLSEYHRIQQDEYREVQLTVDGKKVFYMVPASFLEGKGCFVTTVDGQEVAMGPCDIPLDTIFDDPNENIVYKMNEAQFAIYKEELAHYLFDTELSEVNGIIENHQSLDVEQKKKAKKLLKILEEKIFKPTIGLSDFVAGIKPLSEEASLYLPGQLLNQVRASLNPIRFLEELVFSTSVFSAS